MIEQRLYKSRYEIIYKFPQKGLRDLNLLSTAGALHLALCPQCGIHSLLHGIRLTQSQEHSLYGDNTKKPNKSCPALLSHLLWLNINHLL